MRRARTAPVPILGPMHMFAPASRRRHQQRQHHQPLAAQAGPARLHLSLALRRLVVGLAGVFLVLLALHLVVVWSYVDGWRFPARDRFFFDRENNLPTFFSTFILMLAAALLGLVGASKRRVGDAFARHWQVMALVFLGLAIDEAASLHELLIRPLRSSLQLTGLLWFGWVIAGAVFVLAFVVGYLRFLAHLPARARWLFVVAGAMYAMGALGLEMVGGWVFLARDIRDYMLVMTLEESLEMAGILLFNYALVDYLARWCPPLSVDMSPRLAGWRRATARPEEAPRRDGAGQ